MVAMPYFQKQLVNGNVVSGPYLSGNPDLRGEISQISGTCSCANQKYNALQATLHKRFSMGLEYQVAYTYSQRHVRFHRLLRPGRRRPAANRPTGRTSTTSSAEWGPTYFDDKSTSLPRSCTRCRSAAARSSGPRWNRGVDGVLGGWQMGGIYTAHTGFPLTIKMSGDPSGTARAASAPT